MTEKNSYEKQDPFLAREAQNYETPIPSREFLISVILGWGGGPVKRHALIKHFSLEHPELSEALRRRLKAMVRDGQLFKSPQGYIPILTQETHQGNLVIEREGEGYLRTKEGETIALRGPTLRGHYDGDEIEVQVIQVDKEGYARGRIVKLLCAVTPLVIGRLNKTHHHYEVLPFDRRFIHNIMVPKEKIYAAKNGDIVQVKILRDEKYRFHVEPIGEVTEVLGDFSTPGIEVKMAIRKFGIPEVWPKAVEKEAEKIPKKVSFSTDERKDLRDLPLVTIDGEDAKDFDDAVYCEMREGGWRLWVAIADVSHYVHPGSALDKEAMHRGNSTYFPGSVIPMLPEKLSNELCSLKPNVPRLCVVCQMSINAQGEIQRSTFYRAVMHSKARLTYTEVSEMVQGNVSVRERYASVLLSIDALYQLYQAFSKQRRHRGAIDFDTLETRILFDKAGKIKSIVPEQRNVAHKMIEESMLAANVCAAKFIMRHKRGALYRVHDRPPQDKLRALRQFLSELGLDLPGHTKPSSKDFSSLIAHIQARQDKHVIETVMLRSLSQAQYTPKNIGHFGLAYSAYLHFTSPIRRYPDLIVHRAITAILADNKKRQNTKEINLEKLGMQCSETERRSDEAARDAQLALKCHYMQDKIGQEFRGIVSGVASFGLFVELKDIYVEGLVHITCLGNEYFHYDSTHHRMIGDNTRTVYRLGDSIEVRVVRVDVEAKKIDLELLNQLPGSRHGHQHRHPPKQKPQREEKHKKNTKKKHSDGGKQKQKRKRKFSS